MKSSLPNLTAYRSDRVTMAAQRFNRVLLVLRRFGSLQQELLGTGGVELHFTRASWLCWDLNLNDRPLLAWTDFEPVRHSVAAPVTCRRILYSAYAGILAERILEEFDRRLERRLAQHRQTLAGVPRLLQFPALAREPA